MEIQLIRRIALYAGATLVLAFIFCVLAPYLLDHTIGYWSNTDYKVLLVGDFNNKSQTNSIDIRNGFYEAMSERQGTGFNFKPDLVNIDDKRIADQLNGPSESDSKALDDDVETQLIKRIASENVVAIVTSSSSQTIVACLKTGKLFNIPVLITSATETDCLKGYESIGFRLIPNSKNQVPRILSWIKTVMHLKDNKNDSQKEETLGIMFVPNRGGISFRDELLAQLKDMNVISFPIGSTTSMEYAMDKQNIGVKKWVVISFQDEARNVIAIQKYRDAQNHARWLATDDGKPDRNESNKMQLKADAESAIWKIRADSVLTADAKDKALAPDIKRLAELNIIIDSLQKARGCRYKSTVDTILFTSGAYGYWMDHYRNDSSFYVLRTDLVKLVEPDKVYRYGDSVPTYSLVAEDAYKILEFCLKDVQSPAKAQLIDNLTHLANHTPHAKWNFDYAFWQKKGGSQGENTMAKPWYEAFPCLDFGELKKDSCGHTKK